MKTNKYNYTKVIQQHYGQGWEDVSEYETNSNGRHKEFIPATEKEPKKTLLMHDLNEYRLTGYPTRVIRRKEPNTQPEQ